MGAYDDLIPGAVQHESALGRYADLVPEDRGDVLRGAKVAIGQTVPILKGVVGLAGATAEHVLGEGGIATGLKNWGYRGYQEGMHGLQPLQKDTDELTTAWDKAKSGDLGALLDWAQFGFGYALGQGGEALAMSLLGGVAGAAVAPAAAPVTAAGGAVTGLIAKGAVKEFVAGLIEKAVVKEANALSTAAGARLTADEAVKQATRKVAQEIGSTGALLAYGGVQELGTIYPEAEKQAASEGRSLTGADLARVWGWGLAAGGVEGLTDKLALKVAGGKIKLPVAASRPGAAALGALGGAAVEGGTEALQTVMEHAGAGQPIADAAGLKDIINSAAQGALGGGVIVGGAAAIHGPAAPAIAPPSLRERADAAFKGIGEARTIDEALAAASAAVPPVTLPAGLDAEGALARMERMNRRDLADQRLWGPDANRYEGGAPPMGAKAAPGAGLDANASTTPGVTSSESAGGKAVEEAPFSDRLLTLREQLQDSRTRQAIRDNLGPEALNDVLYYAQAADDASLPGTTSDRMLALAEALVQRSILRPITQRAVQGSQGDGQPGIGLAPRPLAIPLDVSPTGTIRVGQGGTAAPETRADVVSMRDRARALSERRGGLTEQTAKGGEPGAGVLVGQGVLTTGSARPAPEQLPAPPGQPGKRGAFEAAEAEQAAAAARKPAEQEAIAAVKRASEAPAPSAMRQAFQSALDKQAQEAATSPTNNKPEPTQAQKEKGNYSKGHVRVSGLEVSIENDAGSTRSGVGKSGKPWSTLMRHHYGYVRGSIGRDKDHVDVFIQPGTQLAHDGPVYVVDQVDPATGRFDEHKALMGFPSEKQARTAYLSNYEAGWKGLGGITKMTTPEFRAWVMDHEATKKPLSLKQRATEMATPKATVSAAFRSPDGEVHFDANGTLHATVLPKIAKKGYARGDLESGWMVDFGGGRTAFMPSALAEAAPSKDAMVKDAFERMRAGTAPAYSATSTRELSKASATTAQPEAAAPAPAPLKERAAKMARKPVESDQERSNREWRENYDRIAVSADITKESTKNIGRARGFISHMIVALQGGEGGAFAGNKQAESQIGVLNREDEMLKDELQRRSKTTSTAPAPEAVAPKGGKPRMAENAKDLWAAIKKASGGVVVKSHGLLYPYLRVVGMSGGDFQVAPGGKIDRVTPDGRGARDATNEEVDELHDAIDKDQVLVIVRSRWGGSGGEKVTRSRDLEVLHSPSGNSFAAPPDFDFAQPLANNALYHASTNPEFAPDSERPLFVSNDAKLAAEAAKITAGRRGDKREIRLHKIDFTPRNTLVIPAGKADEMIPEGWINMSPVTARRFADQGYDSARIDGGSNELVILRPSRRLPKPEDFDFAQPIYSDAFKQWFGDSKVVDADGKPLVVYHGTRSSFPIFTKVGDDGIYFTSNPKLAGVYARGRGGNIVAAYVALPDPQVFEFTGKQSAQAWWDTHQEAAGARGAIVRNTTTGSVLVVASRPEQIKSAIGNNGAFDASNPDIRFAEGWGSVGNIEAPSTVESATAEVRGLFGDRADSVVTVVATADDLPADVRASVSAAGALAVTINRSRVYIVADRVPQGAVRGLVMHELGVHFGMDRATIDRLAAQVQRWAKEEGRIGDMARWAIRAAEQSKSTHAEEEPVAYMVQALTDAGMTPQKAEGLVAGFINRVVRALKALGRRLGMSIEVTPQDMVDFAYGAANVALERGVPQNTVGQQFASILSGIRGFDQTAARNVWTDWTTSYASNLWFNGLRTQYAKAQAHPDTFGPVFDATNDYVKDTTVFARAAADKAPSILPTLDDLADLFSDFKKHGVLRGFVEHGAATKDVQAAGVVLRQGTLEDNRAYGREELEAAGLSAEQQKLYFEARAAIDQSLDDLGKSEIVRLAGQDGIEVRQPIMQADNIVEAGQLLGQYLRERAEQTKRPILARMADDIDEKVAHYQRLKDEGYAPIMRFGRHTVHVWKDKSQPPAFFGMYETNAEANAVMRDLKQDPELAGMHFQRGLMSEEAYRLYAGVPMDALELFARATGAADNEVYQDFIRLTKNNRSVLKRLMKRQGVAGYSEDTRRTLAAFVMANSRMASGNLNLGRAKQAADDIPKELGDIKDDAINLVRYVQDPQEESPAIRGVLFANFIGGSVASAATNLTQPLTMTLPYLSQYGGVVKATGHLIAAARMAASGKIEGDLAEALEQAEADGIVSPQEIHHLQAEAMSAARHPMVKKALFIWGSMFSLSEQFNRRVSFIAAWNVAREQQMRDPFEFAEKAVIETQGLYGKQNKPNWARGPIGSVAMTFKQFSIHYLEFLNRMWRSGPEGKKAVGVALGILALTAGVGGLPFADDLDDLVDTLAQAMGYDFSSKKAKRRFIAETLGLGDVVADVATRGLTALPGFPMDMSMRMGMGNLLPGTGALLRSNTDRTKDVLEFAGPAGRLFQSALEGGGKVLSGDMAGAGMGMAPQAVQNMAKAVQMWNTGEYRNTKDQKVMNVDAVDATMKFIGFQPAQVARESMVAAEVQRSVQLAKNVEGEIAAKWAQGLADKDTSKVEEARDELKRWNESNPSTPMRLTMQQIIRRVREMQATRAERAARSAPKELRGKVREAFQ